MPQGCLEVHMVELAHRKALVLAQTWQGGMGAAAPAPPSVLLAVLVAFCGILGPFSPPQAQ